MALNTAGEVVQPDRNQFEASMKTVAAVALFVFAFFGSRDGVLPKVFHLGHSDLSIPTSVLFAINVVLLPMAVAFLLRLVQRWNSNIPALIGGLVVSLVAPFLDNVGVSWFASSLLGALPVILGIAAAAWSGSWLASRILIRAS